VKFDRQRQACLGADGFDQRDAIRLGLADLHRRARGDPVDVELDGAGASLFDLAGVVDPAGQGRAVQAGDDGMSTAARASAISSR